ncbi:MAG: bifunctional alpha/beta hydrolase/OsmC family protein [Pseudomonadota bacterium]
MASQPVQFTNRDGITLAGLIDRAPGGERAMALFAHCFTCTKNLKAATNIANALNTAGISVMRFDFTGLGSSEGDFSQTTFSNNVSDLVDAANWLAEQGSPPAILIGHSLGGTAMLQASLEIDTAVAVATIGSPATPEHVTHLFADHEADIIRDGAAEVQLAGRPFTIRREFIEDLGKHPLAETVHNLRKALLILHSPIDDTVTIDNASQLFSAAMHPKSFVSLDHADHLLSNAADSAYAGTVLAGWASRYLPDEPQTERRREAITAITDASGFTTPIHVGEHTLVADEPASVGGADLGPSPVELMTASLAACTSMTLKMYARHKSLPLDEVSVTVTREQTGRGDDQVVTFHRDIAIKGDLDEIQRERMVEIADKCPVHRALHGTVEVVNHLVEVG